MRLMGTHLQLVRRSAKPGSVREAPDPPPPTTSCPGPTPTTCPAPPTGKWWSTSWHDITMTMLISDYFSYVPTIPGPPHSPGNNSYQVKQRADYILCQIFMLIYLQAGSPHHMAPHQNSFVSKVGSDFEFYISISRLIPRTVRHFKGREDYNISLF